MSMRFKSVEEAKEWLKQTNGNKQERQKLDANQKWSFLQAKHACNNIIGEWENYELDTNEKAALLHGDRKKLINYIYHEMQSTVFDEGFEGWGQDVGKRHGYSTKNFVLGAIDYFCEKNGY